LQAIEQLPPPQLGVPLLGLHDMVHPPQCATLVWVLISQPLECDPSQLP
jgi:hypothetical protein